MLSAVNPTTGLSMAFGTCEWHGGFPHGGAHATRCFMLPQAPALAPPLLSPDCGMVTQVANVCVEMPRMKVRSVRDGFGVVTATAGPVPSPQPCMPHRRLPLLPARPASCPGLRGLEHAVQPGELGGKKLLL